MDGSDWILFAGPIIALGALTFLQNSCFLGLNFIFCLDFLATSDYWFFHHPIPLISKDKLFSFAFLFTTYSLCISKELVSVLA